MKSVVKLLGLLWGFRALSFATTAALSFLFSGGSGGFSGFIRWGFRAFFAAVFLSFLALTNRL